MARVRDSPVPGPARLGRVLGRTGSLKLQRTTTVNIMSLKWDSEVASLLAAGVAAGNRGQWPGGGGSRRGAASLAPTAGRRAVPQASEAVAPGPGSESRRRVKVPPAAAAVAAAKWGRRGSQLGFKFAIRQVCQGGAGSLHGLRPGAVGGLQI